MNRFLLASLATHAGVLSALFVAWGVGGPETLPPVRVSFEFGLPAPGEEPVVAEPAPDRWDEPRMDASVGETHAPSQEDPLDACAPAPDEFLEVGADATSAGGPIPAAWRSSARMRTGAGAATGSTGAITQGANGAPPSSASHAGQLSAALSAARPEPEPAETRPASLSADAPRPEYPSIARRRGWEGTVLLRLSIAADGSLVSTEVAASSGRAALDEAAVAAARRWTFAAARSRGAAVDSKLDVPVVFRLAD